MGVAAGAQPARTVPAEAASAPAPTVFKNSRRVILLSFFVDMLHSPEALQGKDLKIFYRSPTTDLVLAASPKFAETLASELTSKVCAL